MESLKRFFLLVMCVGAISAAFTSCLSDDDDDDYSTKVLSPADKAAQLAEIQGIYFGDIHLINDTTAHEDSVSTGWTVTAADSTLSVRIPVKVFGNGMTVSTARNILLASEETVTLTGNLHMYYNENIANKYYTFTFAPKDNKLSFTVNSNDKSYDVSVTFTAQMSAYVGNYYQNLYCIGEYMNNKMDCYILPYTIHFDGADYTCVNPLFLYGHK